MTDADRFDDFARAALTGIISNPSWNSLQMEALGIPEIKAFGIASRVAYQYAEAMMKVRAEFHAKQPTL